MSFPAGNLLHRSHTRSAKSSLLPAPHSQSCRQNSSRGYFQFHPLVTGVAPRCVWTPSILAVHNHVGAYISLADGSTEERPTAGPTLDPAIQPARNVQGKNCESPDASLPQWYGKATISQRNCIRISRNNTRTSCCLTLKNWVVTICTTRCNIQQLYFLPKQCIYVFCVDLRTNSDYLPIQH